VDTSGIRARLCQKRSEAISRRGAVMTGIRREEVIAVVILFAAGWLAGSVSAEAVVEDECTHDELAIEKLTP
jgi:hypothetical protein